MTLLDKAIDFATKAHAGVTRKGKNTPYILHPLEAMLIVKDLTDDEKVLAAAVLHDTVEDTDVTKDDIREIFGGDVARLVAAESENKREDLPAESTWEIRKKEPIDELQNASREFKLICLGDKLANLRELSRDYAELGDSLWERFNQKDKTKHSWYYGEIYKILLDEFGDKPAILEYRSLLEKVFGWKGDE